MARTEDSIRQDLPDCSRFSRSDDLLLLVDGSRGEERRIPGLAPYQPACIPMNVSVAERRTEIMVSWSDKPLIAEVGDLILTDGNGHQHPIKKDLFDKTYSILDDGRAVKTTVTKARRIHEPDLVDTLEGEAPGKAGDWLAQGAGGECWPIPDESFRKRYQI